MLYLYVVQWSLLQSLLTSQPEPVFALYIFLLSLLETMCSCSLYVGLPFQLLLILMAYFTAALMNLRVRDITVE